MKNFSRLALVGAALFVTCAAMAQSAVGTWSGKLDLSAVKAKTDQEKQQIEMAKTMLANMVITVVLKKDKTCTMSMSGVPNGPDGPKEQKGTWTQSGKSVTVKQNSGKGKPMVFTMSADGKSMTAVPPADEGGPKGLKLVLKKKK
jgi:hypothetical protein